MSKPENSEILVPRPRRWLRRWLIRLAVLAVVVYAGSRFMGTKEQSVSSGTTFTARRGPLKITVTEGGSIDAIESQRIKSEVEGQTKILAIVDEGYMVTQEDVDKGKILVELDATELVEKQTNHELEYQNSLAALTEAREAYDIQLNQNRSDISAAALDVKFARMDFEKYLGADATKDLLAKIDAENALANEQDELDRAKSLSSNGGDLPPTGQDAGHTAIAGKEAPQVSGEASATSLSVSSVSTEPVPDAPPAPPVSTEATLSTPPAPVAPAPPEPPEPSTALSVDFAKLVDAATLGDGEAGQKLRKLEDDYVLSKKEVGLSQTQFEGTKRLAEKEFVTKMELENEQLKVEQNEIALESAETSKGLFIKYEFPKEAEKLLSGYREALRKLERAKKLAVSKLAQAEAQLKSAEKRYALQKQKRDKIAEQISKCKIKAEKTGLVVYGGGERRYWRGDEEIKEGATVYERQEILTIPDLTRMCVKVKIHESAIKQISKGQKAKIKIDAFADEELSGEVFKVAVLPDSENRWMNPDVKVYETQVSIDGAFEWLKPGLSSQVEILVKELPDVLYVPIQAVTPSNGERVCYIAKTLGEPERRVVKTGEFNNEFIEIKEGLSEGEVVLLRAPSTPEEAVEGKEGEKKEGEGKEKKPERERPPRPEAPPPSPGGGGGGPQG